MIHALLLILALAGPTVRPNVVLTPGAIRPLSTAVVCATKWGVDRRMVTIAMKKQVAAAYGIPWADHANFEFDHKIPRALAGADVVANLAPQCCREGNRIVGDAHLKDLTENAMHRRVCAGTLPLKQAQDEIATDWIAAYHRYVIGATKK